MGRKGFHRPQGGEYLVDDVEEFAQITAPSTDVVKRNRSPIRDGPCDIEVKVDPLTQSILDAIEMENNKMTRLLRELLADGLTKPEQKKPVKRKWVWLVADALDIDLDEYREKQAKMIEDTMVRDYNDMTVADLKSILREKDLPVSGKKADLVARLQDSE